MRASRVRPLEVPVCSCVPTPGCCARGDDGCATGTGDSGSGFGVSCGAASDAVGGGDCGAVGVGDCCAACGVGVAPCCAASGDTKTTSANAKDMPATGNFLFR